MSQATPVIATGSGAVVRAAINAALAAIDSGHSGSADPSYVAAGMLYWRTDIPGAGTWTLYAYDGGAKVALGTLNTATHVWTPVGAVVPRSYLAGLTLSAAGGVSTFGIAAGVAADTTNTSLMTLPAAYTKGTGAWVVGSGNGSLDTGVIAINTWYHAHLIQRTDTGVVDVLTSLSPSAPTLPAGYTLSRRIGSMKTDASSHWIPFIQDGDRFDLNPFVVDQNGTTVPTGGNAAITLGSVPSGIVVEAIVGVLYYGGGAGYALVYSGLATPLSALTGINFCAILGSSGNGGAGEYRVTTNTSQQIQVFTGINGNPSTPWRFTTMGWIDRRGRDN